MTLWFRRCYVADILSGKKRDTIRRVGSRLPRVGQEVSLSVGPRPAFARALITSADPVSLAELDQERAAAVQQMYGSDPLVRLRFDLVAP